MGFKIGWLTWEQRKLGDVLFGFKYGLNTPAIDYDEQNKYLRITDIDDNTHQFMQDKLTSPKNRDDSYLLKSGDILFARTGASVGKTYEYHPEDGKVYYAGFLIKGSTSNNNDASFIFFSTLLNRYIRFVKVTSMRSGQPGINANEYKKYSLYIPPKNEQCRISKLLKKIDAIITLQQRKLDQLNILKKGLLQKMFADKKHPQPELRFKGFSGDWEQRKLGDLVIIRSGLSTNTQKRDGLYKITRIETISEGVINENKVGTVSTKPDNKFLMHIGDILFSNINSLSHIGKVAIFNGSFVLYHGMNLLRLITTSLVNPYFIYYELTTTGHKTWAKAHANPAVSQANINQHELSLETMYITSLVEQEQTARLINKLHTLITLQQKQIDKLNSAIIPLRVTLEIIKVLFP